MVGRAASSERLKEAEMQRVLDFSVLSSMPPPRATKRIGEALAWISTRMVSKEQPEASPKVMALTKNLAFLRTYPDCGCPLRIGFGRPCQAGVNH